MTVSSDRPELVEGMLFFSATANEGQGFDKLCPNGMVTR